MSFEESKYAGLEFLIWIWAFIGLVFLTLKMLESIVVKKKAFLSENKRAPIIKQIFLPLIPLVASLGEERNLIIGLAIYSLSLSSLAKSEWRLWLILLLGLSPLLLLLNNFSDTGLAHLVQTISFILALYGTVISIWLHCEEHYSQKSEQDVHNIRTEIPQTSLPEELPI